MSSLSASQAAINEALDAFSQGNLTEAQRILETTAAEEAARGDLEEAFAVRCANATLAAMMGSQDIARITGVPPAPSGQKSNAVQISTVLYLEGLAALTKSKLEVARRKFELAKREDQYCILASLGLASLFFQQKRYKESFGQYRGVLTSLGSDASPPIVRVGMGLCAYYLNQPTYAQKAFERALEINAKDELALFGLLVLYVDRRAVAGIARTVSRLHKLLPHNCVVLLRMCDLMYFKAITQKRIKIALRPIHALLTDVRRTGSAEECAVADFQQGRLLLVSGDAQGAKPLLEAALHVLPNLLPARIHYARALLLTGQIEEGETLLRRVNIDHPNEREVLQLLATYATRRGDHVAAMDYCQHLVDAAGQGNVASFALASWCTRLNPSVSEELLSTVVEVQRRHGESPHWQTLANLAVLKQDTAALQGIMDAELGGDFLSRDKPLAVEHVPLVFNTALLLEKRDSTRARQLYIYLVKHQSCFTLPYIRLHTMAQQDGRVRQSVAWLTLLQQVVPDDATVRVYLGHAFFEQRHYRTAIDTLKGSKSVRTIPSALALGAVYLWCSQQRVRESVDFLKAAKDRFSYVLKHDQNNLLAAHGLACCLGIEKDFERSQSLLERVCGTKANCDYVRHNCRAHMANNNANPQSGRYKQAIDYLRRTPDKNAAQNSCLAFCLACEGAYTESIDTITRTAAAHPEQPMLQYNVSLVCCAAFVHNMHSRPAVTVEEGQRLNGLLEKALTHAHKFLQVEPSSRLMSNARLFLKSICTFCLRKYNTVLPRLVRNGKESEEELRRGSERWREAMANYRADIERDRNREALIREQHRKEQELRQQQVIESFRTSNLDDPYFADLPISETEGIPDVTDDAVVLAGMHMSDDGAMGEAAELLLE